MSYSLPLQQLLKSVLKEAPIVEPTLWVGIYNQLRSDRVAFLRGNHVSYMKYAPQSVIGQLVELYELAIEEHVLYSKTSQVPWSVGISTIDALETIWETHVGKPCEPIPKLMFISLMRITLHLENSGYSGFKSFKQKWQQLQSWMDDGYVSDVAALTMSCLARMGKSFLQKMPIETKKWLYKESEALYTTDILDPAMWNEKQKQDCLVELSRTVIADNDLDETFKQSFRQHLEGTKNGDEVGKRQDCHQGGGSHGFPRE